MGSGISKSNTPLHSAAYKGNVQLVESLIAQGADVNALNSTGSTPMHSALYFSYPQGVLHRRHWTSDSSWYLAHNKFAAAKLLVERGANVNIKDQFGKAPLDLAPKLNALAKTGQTEAMMWLHSMDPVRWNPIEKDAQNRTALHAAAYCGRNWDDSRQLSKVAVDGKCAAATWLIAQGCKPKQNDKSANSPDSICTAVYRGKPGYEHKAKRPGRIYVKMQRALRDAPKPTAQPMYVIIPDGCVPGSAFQIATPAGGAMQVTCPAGSKPGDQVQIMVPA